MKDWPYSSAWKTSVSVATIAAAIILTLAIADSAAANAKHSRIW
jgi:hypothetical protein